MEGKKNKTKRETCELGCVSRKKSSFVLFYGHDGYDHSRLYTRDRLPIIFPPLLWHREKAWFEYRPSPPHVQDIAKDLRCMGENIVEEFNTVMGSLMEHDILVRNCRTAFNDVLWVSILPLVSRNRILINKMHRMPVFSLRKISPFV